MGNDIIWKEYDNYGNNKSDDILIYRVIKIHIKPKRYKYFHKNLYTPSIQTMKFS